MPLALADPPGSVVRVGRRHDPFDWPPPPALMAALPDPPGGYRWDDPEGSFQTLYVATEPTGAFIETLQDLRPRADLKAIISRETDVGGGKIIRSSGIPEAYFHTRSLAHADLIYTSGKFIDVADPRTHAWLTQEMPELLATIGEERFERPTVMTNNRRMTRTIAGRLHAFDELDGHPIMGLRYESKIGDFECWALWRRGNRVESVTLQAITRHTPQLVRAAELMEVPITPASKPPRGA